MSTPSGTLFALTSKSFQLLSGMLFVLLLPHFLSLEHQGLYYSLSALVGVLSISENGLAQSLLVGIGQKQLNSHQQADLSTQSTSLSNQVTRQANDIFKLAILSVLKRIVIISVPLSFIAYFILSAGGLNLSSVMAWLLMLLGSSFIVIMNLFQSTEEAIFGPKAANKSRMETSIVQSCLLPIFLVILKSNLFYGLYLIAGSMYYFTFKGLNVLNSLKKAPRKLNNRKSSLFSSYKALKKEYKEFHHLNRNIGLAFVIGYFSMQAFAPAIYYLISPSSSGQWGLTYQVVATINYACFTLVSTQQIHLIKAAISNNSYQVVSRIRSRLWLSIILSMLLAVSFFSLVFFSRLTMLNDLIQRFLPMHLVLIMTITIPFSQFTFFYAMVFRSHHIDPTRKFNIISLIFLIVALPALSFGLGLSGSLMCYCILVIAGFFVYRKSALPYMCPT